MELAAHEQHELDAIAQHVAEEDPALVTKLTRPAWYVRLPGPALFVVGLLTTYLAGLTAMIAGGTLSSWPLIAAGAAVTAIYPVKITVQTLRRRSRE